jgi:hypothetical protein
MNNATGENNPKTRNAWLRQICAIGLMFWLGAAPARAAESGPWTLASDDTEARIAIVNSRPVLEWLGAPGESHNWLSRPIAVPLAAGEAALTWRFVGGSLDNQSGTLTLRFLNDKPELRCRLFLQARPGHGPVRQWAEVENRSSQEVKINPPPCLAVNVSPRSPAAIWWVNRGGSDASKQGGTFTEPVVKGMSKLLQPGPGGPNPIPWMAVQAGTDRGLYVGWEYPGNGQLHVRTGTEDATLELKFTLAEKQLPIEAGQTLWIPPAFVGCYKGDVDDGSYCLHRFYLEKLRPPMPKDCPDPLLTYNVYFAVSGDPGYLKKDAALLTTHMKLAQEFGFEAFVLDAIWFPGQWQTYAGPWIFDPQRFSDNGKSFEEFCHRHGMKFGLWCSWGRCFNQAEQITHQLVTQNRLDYLKHDLDGLIPGGGYTGTLGYYRVQDSLRKAFANLILENCSAGGTIKDYGAMSRAHYVVTTDNLSSLPDRMSIYDSTFAFPPMVLQTYTWLSNDKPGPYLWRSGMMGAWVIDTPPLPNEAETIKKATATYKRWIRPILRDCKVHHVLPRPDGKRWDGLFYWGPRLKKGVLFIFRPQSDQARHLVTLKGLEPKQDYWVWSEDGAVAMGLRSGDDLMQNGLDISLPTPFSSDLVFVQDKTLGKPAAD